MSRLNFRHAPDALKQLMHDIVSATPEFRHIDPHRVHLIFSNSNTRALAYCHQMSKRYQFAMNLRPNYVIELISSHWQKLSPEQKAKVIIHELYHIPRTFSGNLRSHKNGFSSCGRHTENRLYHNYIHHHPSKTREEVLDFLHQALSQPGSLHRAPAPP